jgi:hypothetical protein
VEVVTAIPAFIILAMVINSAAIKYADAAKLHEKGRVIAAS